MPVLKSSPIYRDAYIKAQDEALTPEAIERLAQADGRKDTNKVIRVAGGRVDGQGVFARLVERRPELFDQEKVAPKGKAKSATNGAVATA